MGEGHQGREDLGGLKRSTKQKGLPAGALLVWLVEPGGIDLCEGFPFKAMSTRAVRSSAIPPLIPPTTVSRRNQRALPPCSGVQCRRRGHTALRMALKRKGLSTESPCRMPDGARTKETALRIDTATGSPGPGLRCRAHLAKCLITGESCPATVLAARIDSPALDERT